MKRDDWMMTTTKVMRVAAAATVVAMTVMESMDEGRMRGMTGDGGDDAGHDHIGLREGVLRP